MERWEKGSWHDPVFNGRASGKLHLPERQRTETHMALAVTPRLMVWFLWANAIPGLCVFLFCIALTLLGPFRAGFGTCCKKGACSGAGRYLWMINCPDGFSL